MNSNDDDDNSHDDYASVLSDNHDNNSHSIDESEQTKEKEITSNNVCTKDNQKNDDDEAEEECLICMEDYSPKDFFKLDCSHRYCKFCLHRYLLEKMDSCDLLKLTCPFPNCDKPIENDTVKKIFLLLSSHEGDANFRKFLRLKRLVVQRADPTTIWCGSPDCNSMLKRKHKQEDSLVRLCKKCGKYTCESCHNQHEPNESCQFRASPNDAWLMENARRCPTCDTAIMKEVGCNLVKCKTCTTRFCFLCGEPANYDHFSNKNSPCNGQLGQIAPRELMAGLACLLCLGVCALGCTPLFVCGVCVEQSVRVERARKKRERNAANRMQR